MKKFLAVLLAIFTCLSFFHATPVSAYDDDNPAEYEQQSTDGSGGIYYIAEGGDMEKLFDFRITDIPNILSWVFDFKTFTVLKKYKDKNLNRYVIKGYWNTPNLQMLAKNILTADISDGYTDETYDVNETEWIVKVGKNASKINAITKYGFKLPNYTYYGEYPKEYMSIQNIVPSGFWDTVWRAIKALFGFSFIEPPDGKNFETISYWNHEYSDKDEELINYIQDNFITYFYLSIRVPWDSDDESEFVVGKFFNNKYIYSGLSYGDRGATDFLEKYITIDMYDAIRKAYANLSVSYNRELLRSILIDKYYVNTTVFQSDIVTNGYGGQSYGDWGTALYLTAMSKYFGTTANDTGSLVAMPNDIQDYITYKILGDEGEEYLDIPHSYGVFLSLYLKQVVEQYNNKKYQFNYLYKFNRNDFPIYMYNLRDIYYLGDDDFTARFNAFFKNKTGSAENPKFSEKLFLYNTLDLTTHIETIESDDPDTPPEEKVVYNYDDHYLKDWYTINTGWNPKVTGVPEIPYIMQVDIDGVLENNPELDALLAGFTNWMVAYRKLITFQTYFNSKQVTKTETPLLGITLWENIDKRFLYYSQCMITNQGEDSECWSEAHSPGNKTTICLADVWVFSGLYNCINFAGYDYGDQLSREDAITIIQTIKAYCGPYFSDVIEKMIVLMESVEEAIDDDGYDWDMDDYSIKRRKSDDYRVMPYDIDTMTDADRTNFTIVDPRVNIYKNTVVGSIISDFSLKINLSIYIKFQTFFVNLAGKLTEFSVWFQQLINFDLFDDWGLSPANLWQNAFVTLVIMLLVLLFIVKTAAMAIGYALKGSGNIAKIISMFLVLVIELGIFTAISLRPQEIWTNVKFGINKVINLGEQLVLSGDELQYLFGEGEDRDPAAAYYLPYLDTWSIYNTGYSLFDNKQLIKNTPYQDDDTKHERWGLHEFDNPAVGTEANWPKVGNNIIEHWSILLLDSFEYHGDNYSLHSVPDETGTKWVNGKRINSNAYRVVDHFLAPRISIVANGSNYKLTTTQNENYNGNFQSGMINVFTKLLNVVLVLCLSIIKFLTFIWLWYQLYVFIFKVILARAAEGKSWKQILIETLSPILAMVVIGAYVGLCILICAHLTGILGLLVEIGLFVVTAIVIRWWSRMPSVFPKTLVPLAALLNMRQTINRHSAQKNNIEARTDAAKFGDNEGPDTTDADKYREYYFNENGSLKHEFRTSTRIDEVEHWIKDTELRIKRGGQASEQDKRALYNYSNYRKSVSYDYDTFERKGSNKKKKNDNDKIKNTDNPNATNDTSTNQDEKINKHNKNRRKESGNNEE